MNFRKKNSEILQMIPFSRNSVKKLRKNFQKILRKYLIIVENARRNNFADNLDLLVSLFVCRASCLAMKLTSSWTTSVKTLERKDDYISTSK